MTSPVGAAKAAAGTSAGAVYVDVLPDFDKFAPRFRARVRALAKGQDSIPVDLDAKDGIKRVTTQLRNAKGRFRKAGETVGDEFERGTDRGFRRFFLSSSWKKRGDQAIKGFATSFATSFKDSAIGAVTLLPKLIGPALILAGVAIAATLAPLIAGALASGILLALGGGLIAVGIASAIDHPKVQKAWAKLEKQGKKTFDRMGVAFVNPLARAMETFQKAIKKAEPTLVRISQVLGPVIDKLAPAMASFALNILPGIEKALKGMQPLWDVLAEMLPQLGTAIGDFFATISEDGPALAIVLKDILKGIIWFIGFLADSINELVFKYITVRKATIATVNWIKMAWGVLVNWWQNTIVPSWDKSVGQVVAFFHHLGDSINKAKDQARASWQWLTNWWTGTIVPSWKKSVGQVQTFFSNLGRWFSETMPNFFKQGAAKFGSALDSMRDYAKKPIIAVVGFINKGLIGPWNWIVDKLGIGKPIGEFHPAGFRDGGPIPGRRGLTRKDNRLAKVQSGEFVMPVDKTRAYLPVLEAMRRGNLPGFADGGIVGLVTNPVGTIGNMVGGPFRDLSNAVGNSPAGQIMKGVANKGKEGLIAKGKALITMLLGGESLSGVGSAIGNIFSGGVGYGLLQPAILGAVLQAKKLFGAPLISGFRAGSRTLSGNLSYHASGRAGDFPAIRALALFFRAVYGSKIKELISPWNDINMWNGRPHAYSGDVFAQHAGTGRFRGNAHVHLALADGGLVGGNDYSTLTGLRSDSHWDRVNENGPRTAIENVNVSYAPNVPTEEALFRTMQKLELLYG